MLAIDLGQSGARSQFREEIQVFERGKLIGEDVLVSLKAVFEMMSPYECDLVALSCSGFNGEVPPSGEYLALCHKYFGATEIVLMDDGIAGLVGALNGLDGVALTIGGGVVAVGGQKGKFAHRDGLGNIFGDEGGGFWLGKLAITQALATRQGRDDFTALQYFFTDELTQFDLLANKTSAEAAVLAISAAKKLLEAADSQIPGALEIRDHGARKLAKTVTSAWRGVDGLTKDRPKIAISGGLARNLNYVKKIREYISQEIPFANFIESKGDNLDGSIWLAKNFLIDAPPLLRWARADSEK